MISLESDVAVIIDSSRFMWSISKVARAKLSLRPLRKIYPLNCFKAEARDPSSLLSDKTNIL